MMASDLNPDMQEELNLRVDDMEDNFATLRDFVLQTMDGVRRRLTELEMGHSRDVQGMREEMHRLSDSFSVQPPVTQPVRALATSFHPQASSTFNNPGFYMGPSKIPEELDQLPEGELKESLRQYMPKELALRKKTNKGATGFSTAMDRSS